MYEYTILLYLLYTTHVHMQCAFEVDQLPTRINICLVSQVSQPLVFRFAFRVTFLFLILFLFFHYEQMKLLPFRAHSNTHTYIGFLHIENIHNNKLMRVYGQYICVSFAFFGEERSHDTGSCCFQILTE